MADGPRVDLPRVDLHSHAGRCFLAGLLQDRGLPSDHINHILGSNALNLLHSILPSHAP
jgi:hypothetical protein